MFFYFLVSFYFIIFTPKCFALAMAAVSAELRAISLNKTCKILQFLLCFANSAHNGQFCAKLCALSRRILTSLILNNQSDLHM